MCKTRRLIFLAVFLGWTGLSAVFAQVIAGDTAPDFTLSDSSGQERSLADFKGSYVVLEWVNPECPFFKKYYGSGNMQRLQKIYTAKGVAWLSMASSAPGLQGHYDSEAWQKVTAEKKTHPTAVLLDPAGTVGRLYGARTTPHMFVINPEGKVIYSGAIDSTASPYPEDIAGSENYVAKALDEAMSGQVVSTPSTKSYGCSIKYAS